MKRDTNKIENLLDQLPSVGRLLEEPEVKTWVGEHGSAVATDAVRQAIDQHRQKLRQGDDATENLAGAVLKLAGRIIAAQARPSLRRVVNATGIILHTGLGRSPLCPSAVEAIRRTAGAYCNLEFDLETGQRKDRASHVTDLLCRITGAEAAAVVNNNAAATLLILNTLAKDRDVIVSRGQLVEIGGSFRLPEIMQAGGARLKEVGTTNRTRLDDYAQAIDDHTAALMRVHTSNYRITGFAEEVSLEGLVRLGQERGLPVIDDLGSGAMMEFVDEPVVRASVATGADVICFSGDKLLGGSQAGVILGQSKYIDACRGNPLMRTYRLDKLALVALEATLRVFLDEPRARREIPVLAMLHEPLDHIERRARQLAEVIRRDAPNDTVEIALDQGYAGGGTLPTHALPSWVVRWRSASHNSGESARRLRLADPPVVARVWHDWVVFDCRTVAEPEVDMIGRGIAAVQPGS